VAGSKAREDAYYWGKDRRKILYRSVRKDDVFLERWKDRLEAVIRSRHNLQNIDQMLQAFEVMTVEAIQRVG
jgi:hypothetical protein